MNRSAMYKGHRYIERSLAQRGIIVTPGHVFVLANSPRCAEAMRNPRFPHELTFAITDIATRTRKR
jgi:hypothetical protein